jgi:anti-sigma-K factor RskA
MNCQIASQEQYDLWSLGLLEETPAADIASHVRDGCPTCAGGVRRSMAMWAALAYASALESDVVPSKALRARIAALAAPRYGRQSVLTMPWTRWLVPGFATAAAITISVTSYRGSHPQQIQDKSRAEIARLQSDAQFWRKRAEARETAPAPPANSSPALPAPVPAAPATAPPDLRLENELANLRRDALSATDALNAERARVARQQQEIDSLRATATASAAAKDEAERKLNALLREPSVAGKDRAIAALTAQVRQLEQDNTRYRETVLRMSQQMNRDTKLVALLNSPSVQFVQLRGSEAGGKAAAKAFIVDGQQVLFYASNLPALPQGRTYQLWLLRGRQPAIASGGTFSGDGLVDVANRAVLTDVRGLAVTEEPAGGSPGPTGHKILVGTVRAL